MRCRVCEGAKTKDVETRDHTSLNNCTGSSNGMEPQAIMEMELKTTVPTFQIGDGIKNDRRYSSPDKNSIHISILCADDDTTLRCIINNESDGGELPNAFISPQPVSDPGHRIKNTVGVIL